MTTKVNIYKGIAKAPVVLSLSDEEFHGTKVLTATDIPLTAAQEKALKAAEKQLEENKQQDNEL